IGASVLLLAIGAILAFAVSIDSTLVAGMTVEWDTVGVILMVIGAIGLLWSLMALSAWRDRGRTDTYVDDARVVERDRIVER
ncbi:hypothetical protein RCL06_24685, partial [Salmonella enterica subsp. enterica serovar Typhimurium]